MGGKQITLSDGRVLTINLYAMTMKEYRGLFDVKQEPDADDVVFARALGLTLDELVNLPQPDYRWACHSVLVEARSPLADPNSQSVSTSPEAA